MILKDQEKPILFGLPYIIRYEDQRAIIEYAYQHASSWSGQVQVWDNDNATYDQTDYFGRVQITKLTDESYHRVSNSSGLTYDWMNWACRLDSDLEWEWIDTPITPILKKYIDQIKHLYIKFNRVLILVQKTGSAIPLHNDKVVKNSYHNEKFVPGPAVDLPLAVSNHHWQYNKYLTLKFPITELPGNNGKPIVSIDGEIKHYDAGANLFAINEVDIMHGAQAVNHRRGVIFLDGLLDYQAVKKELWSDINLS